MAGVYTSSQLNLNPVQFNISGELAIAFPIEACQPITSNITGKIAFVAASTGCSPSVKARHVESAGGIAMAMFNTGVQNAHTGYLYYS